MSAALRNLTLASAKHLVSQGHISGAHHKRIVKKVGGKMKAPAAAPVIDDTASQAAFGALNIGAGHYMGSMPEEGTGGGNGV